MVSMVTKQEALPFGKGTCSNNQERYKVLGDWGMGGRDSQPCETLERSDSARKVPLVRKKKMPPGFLTVADPRGRQLILIWVKTQVEGSSLSLCIDRYLCSRVDAEREDERHVWYF